MKEKLGHMRREKNVAGSRREAEFLNHIAVRLANGSTHTISLTDHEWARAFERGKQYAEAQPARKGWLRSLFG
jgi:hypothetical protein